jgi:hypothetical protein
VSARGSCVTRTHPVGGCGLVKIAAALTFGLLLIAALSPVPSATASIHTTTTGSVCCPSHTSRLKSLSGYAFKGRTSPSLAGQLVRFQYKRPWARRWRAFKVSLSGSRGGGFYVLNKRAPRDAINKYHRWSIFFSPRVKPGYWKIRALFRAQNGYTRSSDVHKVRVSHSSKLSWAPPSLTNPLTLNVPRSGGWFRLDSTRDYIIKMGDVHAVGGVVLEGGHNVVLIGGHITIPWAGTSPATNARRALYLKGQGGTVHVEGLLIDNQAGDLGEGIQIAAQNAIVQLENVRVTDIHARDEVGFTDSHPDIVQPHSGYKELRVDRLTGRSDYQGIFLTAEGSYTLGKTDLRNVNLIGLPTAHYLFWQNSATTPVSLANAWIDRSQTAYPLGASVYPDLHQPSGREAKLSTDGTKVYWPTSNITGYITSGRPPERDFVPTGVAGVDYVSPGYVGR